MVRVIDGDTIDVIEEGQHASDPERSRRGRYIGMNTPEVESKDCYSKEDTEINKNLVLDKTVSLEKDISDMDKYGRLLRYVYINGLMVDDYLVKNGFAKIMPLSPDIKYKNMFLNSENYAKENKLGLWGKCL